MMGTYLAWSLEVGGNLLHSQLYERVQTKRGQPGLLYDQRTFPKEILAQ